VTSFLVEADGGTPTRSLGDERRIAFTIEPLNCAGMTMLFEQAP
jgi:hypothetical protein